MSGFRPSADNADHLSCRNCPRRLLIPRELFETIYRETGWGPGGGLRVAELLGGWLAFFDRKVGVAQAWCGEHRNNCPAMQPAEPPPAQQPTGGRLQ